MNIQPHEHLLLSRLRSGLKQPEWGRRYGVSARVYREYENGRRPVPEDWSLPPLGTIHQYERYIILRERSGKTKAQVASEIGCSRHWVEQMERGEVSFLKLAQYWRGKESGRTEG